MKKCGFVTENLSRLEFLRYAILKMVKSKFENKIKHQALIPIVIPRLDTQDGGALGFENFLCKALIIEKMIKLIYMDQALIQSIIKHLTM